MILLALAVPLQGFASVAAGQCMAFGHHHQDAGSQDHEHHAHDDGTDEGKSPHCGPCTACCASASIAGAAPLSLLPSASHLKYAFLPLAPPGVEPQRFDRPPLAL